MNIQPPALPSLATFIISILIALGVTATIWAYGQKDPEQIYSPMPITNAHKSAKKCSDCHDPWKGVSDDKCIKCHPLAELKDPTDPDAMKFAGIHRKAINDNQSCLDCHTEHLGKNSKITKNFDHNQLGNNLNCLSCHQSDSPKNDLHQNIKGQNCSTCHNTTTWEHAKFDHAILNRDANCLSCHQSDAPKNDFHATMKQNCSACHTTDTWKNAKFDHAKSGFPLTGKHAEVSCKECHKTGEFKKLDKSCFVCHQQDDKHNGSMGSNCAQCHNTIKWEDVSFIHNKFPITSGEHRNISCQECHPNKNNYREFTCLSCHEHSQDRMDRKHKGEVLGYNYDSQACYKCHPQGTEHEGGEGGEHGEDD
jgi:predicted CXXCH cytochrome family protein